MNNKKCRILLIKGSLFFIIFVILSIVYWVENDFFYLDGNELIWLFTIFIILGSIVSGIAFWYRYATCLMGWSGNFEKL
jgi:uncharacterized integral membrane protein